MLETVVFTDRIAEIFSNEDAFILMLIGAVIFLCFLLVYVYFKFKVLKYEAAVERKFENRSITETNVEPVKEEKKPIQEPVKEEKKPEEIRSDVKELYSKNPEINIILQKMQDDMKTRQDEFINTFEDEQEEKAVISYQELLKANKKTPDEEFEEEQLDEIKPIKNVEKNYDFLFEDEAKEEVQKEEIKKEEKTEVPDTDINKKFRNSEIISPVYGRITGDSERPIINNINPERAVAQKKYLEKTKLELEEGEKFLQSLKAFRNNLE